MTLQKKKFHLYRYLVLTMVTMAIGFMGQSIKSYAETVTYSDGDWTYSIDTTNSVAAVTKYSGSATKPLIPTTVTYSTGKEYKVSVIGNELFKGNTKITEVAIPDSIEKIGYGAFYKCTSVVSATIGSGVKEWGNTDRRNGYHDYEYPNSAFEGCTALTNLVLKSGIKSIGSYSFYGCDHITSVTVPESSESVGNYAFTGCTKLTKVNIANGTIGNGAFEGCRVLTLLDLKKITSIGDCAFKNCVMLIEADLPQEVEYIGNEAFRECVVLENITIPDKVETIGYGAFYKCTKLSSVIIGSGVTKWTSTDRRNGYHDYTYPNSAFEQCISLKTLVVKEGAANVGAYAFYGCTQLQGVELPKTLEEIGAYAFYDCKDMTKIQIKNGIVGDNAFTNCENVTELTIESSTSIGYQAFLNCKSFEKLVLPENLTYIGSEAFKECNKLTAIIIPDQVETIGYAAFYNCFSMKSVVIGKGVKAWSNCDRRNGYVDYQSLNGAFMGCTALETATIKAGVTNVGIYTFYKCTALKEIKLPASVTEIGTSAFAGCEVLAEASMSCGKIGDAAFMDCVALEKLTLANTTSIGNFAFKNCVKLPSVTLPATAVNIGAEAFYGTALTDICIPNAVLTIGYGAFAHCDKLTDAIIGSAITTWGVVDRRNSYIDYTAACYTFFGDTALKNVYLCDGISTVGSYVFYGCTSLEKAYLPTTLTTYGDNCFDTQGNPITFCVIANSKQQKYTEDNELQSKIVKDISKANITLEKKAFVYSGNPYTPKTTIQMDGATLVEGVDYRLVYYNNLDVGAATVFVVGMGEYGNTNASSLFIISEKAMTEQTFTVQVVKTVYDYTGQEITPNIIVKDEEMILTEGKDYYLSYGEGGSINAGTVQVSVVGIGNYSGTIPAQFTIQARDISQYKPEVKVTSFDYVGKEIIPEITLKEGEKLLTVDKDYVVTYANNINVGTASYTITGKGNYTGTITGSFEIKKVDLSNAGVTLSDSVVSYTGYNILPVVTVKVGVVELKENKDYTVEYSNNLNAGTATIKITGTENYFGTIEKTFTIVGVTLEQCDVTMLTTARLAYTGKELTPSVKVARSGVTYVVGRDYTVKYSDNKMPGTAKLTITGLGNVTGEKEMTFTIQVTVGKVSKLSAISKAKKKATLSWAKVSGATGYEVYQYNAKTKKWTKIKTLSKNTLTVSKLKSKTSYKFKVRAYKKVGQKTYTGSYSSVKSCKIK